MSVPRDGGSDREIHVARDRVDLRAAHELIRVQRRRIMELETQLAAALARPRAA